MLTHEFDEFTDEKQKMIAQLVSSVNQLFCNPMKMNNICFYNFFFFLYFSYYKK